MIDNIDRLLTQLANHNSEADTSAMISQTAPYAAHASPNGHSPTAKQADQSKKSSTTNPQQTPTL